MAVLTLTRGDPTKNLDQYYRLDMQPDLFGMWCFIGKRDRIGQWGGRNRGTPCSITTEAQLRT
jgi:hypothetical protein